MNVLILGGGFCGASVAKVLQENPHFKVTLIDQTSYFEYSGSVPKVVVHPEYAKRLILPYTQFLKKTHVLTGEGTKVTPTFVETQRSASWI